MGIVKKWEDLDDYRKFELLEHWFYYYGGLPYSLGEFEKFRKLAKTNANQIFDFIITSFINKKTIQSNELVRSMRKGKVRELFDSNIKCSELDEEEKRAYESERCLILEEIETTFVHPEPPIPIDLNMIFAEDGPIYGIKK